jgi:hypothetical protein
MYINNLLLKYEKKVTEKPFCFCKNIYRLETSNNFKRAHVPINFSNIVIFTMHLEKAKQNFVS